MLPKHVISHQTNDITRGWWIICLHGAIGFLPCPNILCPIFDISVGNMLPVNQALFGPKVSFLRCDNEEEHTFTPYAIVESERLRDSHWRILLTFSMTRRCSWRIKWMHPSCSESFWTVTFRYIPTGHAGIPRRAIQCTKDEGGLLNYC